MEKYQAFWPLPGGGDQYVDALQKVLLLIKETRPTEDQIRDWFFENLESASTRFNAWVHQKHTMGQWPSRPWRKASLSDLVRR